MFLQSGDRFVLIGDSITDVGRREDPEGLGFGYVRLFHDLLRVRHPELDVDIVNQGISGDTVRHLDARWTEDVLAARPDVLSVSIGVNDVWRQLQDPPNEEQVFLEEFDATYRALLDKATRETGCRIVLCEATVIGETREAPHNPIIDRYNACIAAMAVHFDAALVPMNRAFWRVIDAQPARAWTTDGVHPLGHGHMLMAATLLETLESTSR